MSAFGKKLRQAQGGCVMFWCPGCKSAHAIRVGDGPGPRWGFNGDGDCPTITPSVLVKGRDFTPKGRADYEAWCAAGYPNSADGAPHSFDSADTVCHTFVTAGRIQFLGDCTHELSGQTVDIPDWPAGVED